MRHQSWIAACAALLLPLAGCSSSAPPERTALPVRTAAVEAMAAASPVRYSANIEPFAQVQLAFKSGGIVQSLRQVMGADGRMRSVQEGDFVSQGTVLASVRQDEYRDKVEQAKANLARVQASYEHARLDWDRAVALFAQQSLTKPNYDAAKAQFDSAAAMVSGAQAELAQAQVALRDCAIVAPFDAWILGRAAELGMVANPMTKAFDIADTRKVKAVFGVPDTFLDRVKLGGKQAIEVEAAPGDIDGVVTSISPAADPKSRVYSIEVTLPNAHNRLRAGMIASLAFGIDGRTPVEAAVPLEAVVRHPTVANAFAVYVADGSPGAATARMRAVEPGEARGNHIAIAKGLKPGERVITTGATLVKDGDPINIIP